MPARDVERQDDRVTNPPGLSAIGIRGRLGLPVFGVVAQIEALRLELLELRPLGAIA
jgi:hypothetical protein